jgi:hypothetical protein
MTDAGFVFPDPGVPKIPLERLDLSSDTAARYVQQSRPFVARVDWPALAWTPESLRQRIGGSKVKLRKKTGENVEATVNEYIDVIDGMRSGTGEYAAMNSPVISLRGPNANPDFESLLADIRLPPFVDPERVTEIYVWMKNIGWYDNRSHAEPNAAANLNLQVRGKKHVWLFPPDDAGLLGVASTREDMMGPPYFSAGQTIYAPSDEHPEFKDVRCYETVLEPGDIVFIPTFWYHWFVHYDAYQLNINTWFYTDQIPLSPVAAEWAYMKALGVALGGFDVAPERFAALPVETQELLAQIARTLVNDRRTTDPRGNKSLFEKARQLQLDKKLLTK